MNNKIKNLLKIKDRRISNLVRNTDISRYRLDLIINGVVSPTIEEAKQIAKALGFPIEKVLSNLINNNNE